MYVYMVYHRQQIMTHRNNNFLYNINTWPRERETGVLFLILSFGCL